MTTGFITTHERRMYTDGWTWVLHYTSNLLRLQCMKFKRKFVVVDHNHDVTKSRFLYSVVDYRRFMAVGLSHGTTGSQAFPTTTSIVARTFTPVYRLLSISRPRRMKGLIGLLHVNEHFAQNVMCCFVTLASRIEHKPPECESSALSIKSTRLTTS